MSFPELKLLESLVREAAAFARVKVLGTVRVRENELPVYSMVFGPNDPTLPCFGLFAGVHGLENVGTHVAVHYLTSFVRQLQWDFSLRERLTQCRLVTIPLINPGGMSLQCRSNPDGIDLMRNAPQDAFEKTHFLVGGHRISPRLPWYRGAADAPMAKENELLVEFIKAEVFPAKVALSLDIHSGFGMRDRLWFPYAKTSAPFPHYPETQLIRGLLRRCFPHHIYKVESQSDAYLINGDIWDYLYDLKRSESQDSVFIPWALEMGSWLWIRKNPMQMFSLRGPFNPVKPHRYHRIMRRHLHLIDFLHRATQYSSSWAKNISHAEQKPQLQPDGNP